MSAIVTASATELRIVIFPIFDQCDTEITFKYKFAIIDPAHESHCCTTVGETTVRDRHRGFNTRIMSYQNITYLEKYMDNTGSISLYYHFDITRLPSVDLMIQSIYLSRDVQSVVRLEQDLMLKNKQLAEVDAKTNRLDSFDLIQLKELAIRVAAKIREFEQCGVCLDKDRDSIILPCCHTFCNNCIAHVVICPLCRGTCDAVKKLY
jgi:hypothetical protein